MTITHSRGRVILDVALSDLPLELLKALDLGRPMLGHRDEEDRPACTGQFYSDFDRANHRIGGGRTAMVPDSVFESAKRFCAGCPIRQECGAYADLKREEGLWGGAYRLRLSGSNTTKNYRVMELLPA